MRPVIDAEDLRIGQVDDPKDKLFSPFKTYDPNESDGRWQLHRFVRACPPSVQGPIWVNSQGVIRLRST